MYLKLKKYIKKRFKNLYKKINLKVFKSLLKTFFFVKVRNIVSDTLLLVKKKYFFCFKYLKLLINRVNFFLNQTSTIIACYRLSILIISLFGWVFLGIALSKDGYILIITPAASPFWLLIQWFFIVGYVLINLFLFYLEYVVPLNVNSLYIIYIFRNAIPLFLLIKWINFKWSCLVTYQIGFATISKSSMHFIYSNYWFSVCPIVKNKIQLKKLLLEMSDSYCITDYNVLQATLNRSNFLSTLPQSRFETLIDNYLSSDQFDLSLNYFSHLTAFNNSIILYWTQLKFQALSDNLEDILSILETNTQNFNLLQLPYMDYVLLSTWLTLIYKISYCSTHIPIIHDIWDGLTTILPDGKPQIWMLGFWFATMGAMLGFDYVQKKAFPSKIETLISKYYELLPKNQWYYQNYYTEYRLLYKKKIQTYGEGSLSFYQKIQLSTEKVRDYSQDYSNLVQLIERVWSIYDYSNSDIFDSALLIQLGIICAATTLNPTDIHLLSETTEGALLLVKISQQLIELEPFLHPHNKLLLQNFQDILKVTCYDNDNINF